MKLIVNPHKIQLVQEEAVNEKEINVSVCEFEFAEEITDDYVKEAYFTLNNDTYKQIIVNNKCSIPQEVLVTPATIELGVVAYYVEDEQEIIRYNPTPVYFKTDLGSLKEAQNSEEPTPSEMEQYEQALQDGLTELNNAVDDLQEKVDSGYFDGKDGVDGITPTIGNNGNWYLGDTDTGKPSRGERGLQGETGATGTAGRDGYVQYTAGSNITIENNVISATGGSSYTAGEGITIANDIISSRMPIYLVETNSYSDPFVIEGKPLGLYYFGYISSPYITGYSGGTSQRVELSNGFIIITNPTVDKTLNTYQQVGYAWGTQLNTIYNTIYNYCGTLSVRGNTGATQVGTSSGQYSVPVNGDCTIYNVKTFNALPESSATPTGNNQLVNKKYVDDKVASAITNALGGEY